MSLQSKMQRKQEALEGTPARELLEYFWKDEPVYHPEFTIPMSKAGIRRARMRALGVTGLYLALTVGLVNHMDQLGPLTWIVGILTGIYVADFISGLAHIYIDFVPSNTKTPLHRELFLSRVHHHELFRPARLNLASLWVSPALYAFLGLAVLPLVFTAIFRVTPAPWVYPFWLCLLWSTAVSQIAHAVSHGKGATTKFVRVLKGLQRIHLILPAKTHSIHHRVIDRNFCVLNGWANSLLNPLFKIFIEKHIPESTSVGKQIADMKKNLSFPYHEIL
jgi:hypothetical protein